MYSPQINSHAPTAVSKLVIPADNTAVDALVEQVMQQAFEQLTTLTGLNQRQASQPIANKYNIPIEQSRNARIIELLNDEESQFIDQLFN